MVTPVGAINISARGAYNDPEYMRIMQDLRALGLTPSGNKDADKAKLQQAKAELIQKIQEKDNEHNNSLQVQTIAPIDEVQDNKRAELEEQRLGAMRIAELNRLYFKI